MPKAKIFHTPDDTLAAFFQKLSLSEIKQVCGSTIYERGKEYYKSACVNDVHVETPQKLVADVSGSEDYTVKIECRRPSVFARCDCPYDYGDVCKHMVAVLIYVKKNAEEIFSEETEVRTGSLNESDLTRLSKKELIELLLRQQGVAGTSPQLTDTQAAKVFETVQQSIFHLFTQDEVMYEPERFEKRLMQQLNKLKPVWQSSQSDAIADFLLEFMQKVDAAFDEGYLYTYDYHGGDSYFESDSFNTYVIEFARTLPQETKFYFVNQLRKCLSNMSFSTFSDIADRLDEFFTKDDLPLLKTEFLENLKKDKHSVDIEQYYHTLLPVLTLEEQQFILKSGYKRSLVLMLEFDAFYKKQNNLKESLKYLHKYLTKHTHGRQFDLFFVNERLLKTYFETAHALEHPFGEVAHTAIGSGMVNADFFIQLLRYLPDQQKSLEATFEKYATEEYFNYLSQQGRLLECQKLIRKSQVTEETAFRFFVSYKMDLREEAESYFLQRIQANLESPTLVCYKIIVETLKPLQEMSPQAAREVLDLLRAQYKRRTALMEMLKRNF
jgi:uncharacterized Zn finger protein